MLIGNAMRQSYSPAVRLGAASAYVVDRSAWAQPGARRNFYAGEATVIAGASIANKVAWPAGYLHPGAWMLPIKPGGMAATVIEGEGEISACNLAGGINGAADLSGSAVLACAAGLIVSILADLTASATLTADVLAKLNIVADLSASGDLVATATGLGWILADLTGDAELAATLTALGELAADITVTGSTLTTANVADAVWNAIAESGLSYQEVVRLLLAVAAGKSTIVDLGGGNAEVAFRDVADTKNRVFAEMVGSERDTVTLDGT